MEFSDNLKIIGLDKVKIKDDFNEPFLTRDIIYRDVRNVIDEILGFLKIKDIDEFIKLYIEHYNNFNCLSYDKPFLSPIESVGIYFFRHFIDNPKSLIENLRDTVLVGYDSSHHNPRGHFLIDFLLHNVGYYYEYIGAGEGGSGYHPYVVLIGSNEFDQEVIGKELEIHLLSHLLKHVEERFTGKRIFLLLDESLNLSYTYAWNLDRRRRYAEKVKEEIDLALSHESIPIGVFYTRARDIMAGIECMSRTSVYPVQDKHIFNRYLSNGSRSQLFEIVSDVLNSIGLEIYAFYLKIDEGNVIRIEFPKDVIEMFGKEVIDDIHKVVYFDSIRNNGYSYVLSRSHEAAVLRFGDREDIEHIIAESLNIPLKYVYSRKESFKRRPLA